MESSQKINILKQEVLELGPWFHQIDLGNGLRTREINPTQGPQPINHPQQRWEILKNALPKDCRGLKVLDIGCADGFFALELARRGAKVTAIDANPNAIKRLNWLTKFFDISNISTEVAKIEQLSDHKEHFDFVFMIALLYHLKYPLLGFEILSNLSDKLYLESAIHSNNEDSFLYLKPPQEGVHYIPKWFPTEKCVLDMLKYVGFSKIEILEPPHNNRGIYLAHK